MRLLILGAAALCMATGWGGEAQARERRSVPRVIKASMPADGRIRYVRFNNDAVTTVPVSLGVSTMIQFQSTETIETISAGETKTWSIVPKKGSSIMFVKPTEPGSRTNVNVVTTKRVYALALSTMGGGAVYQVRFRYPEEEAAKSYEGAARESANHPDLKDLHPSRLNYDYVYKGADALKPRVVFDTGEKTFFEFTGEYPSIFLVKEGGEEATVNSRREGRFMVVDGVGAQFTLRAGGLATCIYNMTAGKKRPDDVEAVYGPRKARSGLSLFAGGASE